MAYLSQKILKELLHYDPGTGVFIWKRPYFKRYLGKVAGGKDKGAIRISIKGQRYPAHRLAWLYMTRDWPKDQIDHIDRDPYNNKWENLREADDTLNKINRGLMRDNSSGVTGVTWKPTPKLWRAYISVNGYQKHIGYYKKLHEAVLARYKAEETYGYTTISSESSALKYLKSNNLIKEI